MCVRSGSREERASFRFGESVCVWGGGRGGGRGVVMGRITTETARFGPGGGETGADQANMEGAVSQPFI